MGTIHHTPFPVPVRYFEPEEGEKILFSQAYRSDYPTLSDEDVLTLAGEPMTAAQLWALDHALSDVPLSRLPDILAEHGLETNLRTSTLDDLIVNGATCLRVLDDRYVYMSLWISPTKGEIGLFFRRVGPVFVPMAMMDSAADYTDAVDFLYFAGQPWMIYQVRGHGTGYHVFDTYWFNIEHGREELRYFDDFYDAHNTGSAAYEEEIFSTENYAIVDGPGDPYLNFTISITLKGRYWDIKEGREVLIHAPEPDVFMGQVNMNLYYDPQTCQFYVRIPLAAVPLAAGGHGTSPMWHYYFEEELRAFLEEGNYFQRQWAATFYRDNRQ